MPISVKSKNNLYQLMYSIYSTQHLLRTQDKFRKRFTSQIEIMFNFILNVLNNKVFMSVYVVSYCIKI